MPHRHLLALLWAAAASRIVYAEGPGWLSRHADMNSMDHRARVYLEQEARLTALVDSLAPYDIAEKETLLRILQRSGRKELTDEALGLV